PNRFIVDWVREKYLEKIKDLYSELHEGVMPTIDVMVGDVRVKPSNTQKSNKPTPNIKGSPKAADSVIKKTLQQASSQKSQAQTESRKADSATMMKRRTNLNKAFTFDSFVRVNQTKWQQQQRNKWQSHQ